MIRAGQLRNRMSLQVPIRSRTAQGGVLVEWAELREIYVGVQSMYDMNLVNNSFRVKNMTVEKQVAGKISDYQSHRITIRAQTERITPDMRLVETNYSQNSPYYRVFNIVEVNMLENKREEMALGVKETPCDNDSADNAFDVLLDDQGYAMIGDNSEYIGIEA